MIYVAVNVLYGRIRSAGVIVGLDPGVSYLIDRIVWVLERNDTLPKEKQKGKWRRTGIIKEFAKATDRKEKNEWPQKSVRQEMHNATLMAFDI